MARVAREALGLMMIKTSGPPPIRKRSTRPYPWRRIFLFAILPLVVIAFAVSAVVPAFNGPALPANVRDLLAAHPGVGSDRTLVSYLSSTHVQWFEETSGQFVNQTGWGVVLLIAHDSSNSSQIHFTYVVLTNWKLPDERVVRVIWSDHDVSLAQIQASLQP